MDAVRRLVANRYIKLNYVFICPTENIDEIVQDHDTFGTDENEEDSMDSLTMALMESRSVATSTASNSSYMSSLSANKIGGKFMENQGTYSAQKNSAIWHFPYFQEGVANSKSAATPLAIWLITKGHHKAPKRHYTFL